MIINCLAPISFNPEDTYDEDKDAYVIGEHLCEEIGWSTNDGGELEEVIDDLNMLFYDNKWYDLISDVPDDIDEMKQDILDKAFIWFQAVL